MTDFLKRRLAIAMAVFVGQSSIGQAQSRLPEYRLAVDVRPDSSWLGVTGSVTLPPLDAPSSVVRLRLHAVFRNATFEIVAPRQANPIAVSTDSTGGYTIWTLATVRPIPPHTAITVRFTYSAPVASARSFHVGNDGSFLEIGWYPQDPDVTARDSRATGDVTVETPAGYTVVGAGDPKSTDSDERAGRHRFVTKVPRRLAFTVGRYTVARSVGPVPLALYLLHDRAAKQAYVDSAARALGILAYEFGRFPYSELAIVEVPGGPARSAGFGGRGVNGMVLIDGSNIDQGFSLAFVAHEMSHQWWGDAIEPTGSDGEQFLLTEAMANYGALRVVERVQGAALAERFRRIGYPGYHDTDLAYYLKFAATGLDTVPLTRLTQPLAHDFAAIKGFRVWDMLADEIGRERFRVALNHFVRAHAFTTITWNTFTSAMGTTAARPIDWFFDEWFAARTGAPEWRAVWRWDGGAVRGTIRAVGAPYRAKVDVAVYGGAPTTSARVTSVEVQGSETNFFIGAGSQPDSVVLDPHFRVLHWTADNAAEPRGTALANRASWLDQLGQTSEALAAYEAGLDSIPAGDEWNQRYLSSTDLAG